MRILRRIGGDGDDSGTAFTDYGGIVLVDPATTESLELARDIASAEVERGAQALRRGELATAAVYGATPLDRAEVQTFEFVDSESGHLVTAWKVTCRERILEP